MSYGRTPSQGHVVQQVGMIEHHQVVRLNVSAAVGRYL